MAVQLLSHPYPYLGKTLNQSGLVVNGSAILYGTYPSGGEPINWSSIYSAFGVNEVNPLGLGAAKANGSALVTALSASAGIITATAANNFIVGQTVTFVGCTTVLGLLLNGQTFAILTASATQFTFASTATGTGTSETGIVVSGDKALISAISSGNLVSSYTALSAASGVITVTAANNFLPGASVTFSGGSGGTLATALNGVTLTVASATGTAFTANSALTGTTGTGTVTGSNVPQPAIVSFWSSKGSGYGFSYDSSIAKLHVQQGGAAVSNPSADIAAGAYNATLLADIVRFEAMFVRV